MIRTRRPAVLATIAGVLWGVAPGARADIPLRAQRVAAGLPQPLFVGSPPGDDDHLFIVSKADTVNNPSAASIRILDLNGNTVNTTPFLTIPNLVTESESGLLGLAFHPDWGQAGSPNKDYFYVNVTVPGGAFGVSKSPVRR